MFYYLFFIVLLVGAAWCAWRISVADMRRRIIPDAYLFPLLIIGLLISVFYGDMYGVGPGDAAIGAAFGYGLGAGMGVLFEYLGRRRGDADQIPIGFGDIKLLAVGGLWLGLGGLAWALIVACASGAVWARSRRTRFIPFAPFFVAGAVLYLLATVVLNLI